MPSGICFSDLFINPATRFLSDKITGLTELGGGREGRRLKELVASPPPHVFQYSKENRKVDNLFPIYPPPQK